MTIHKSCRAKPKNLLIWKKLTDVNDNESNIIDDSNVISNHEKTAKLFNFNREE